MRYQMVTEISSSPWQIMCENLKEKKTIPVRLPDENLPCVVCTTQTFFQLTLLAAFKIVKSPQRTNRARICEGGKL